MEIKNRLQSLADRETWAARGASILAKTKATKVVWFPPEPVKTGKKASAAAGSATRRTARKSTGAAKKTTGAARKTTGAARKKSTAARKRATSSSKA